MIDQPSAERPMDAYVRVSAVGERGGDESYGSPEVQEQAIRRWAEYQNVPIGRVLIDEDWSGGTQDRPGLDAARDRALSGITQGFAVYNVSRFSRFTEGGLADLRRLREAGARIAFVQEQLDTSTPNGRLVFTILLATHEAALEQIKLGWKVVKARAIDQGRQIGPTPPGYVRAGTRNGQRRGQLIPDDERGQAITRAYQAVAREQDVRAAVPILAEAFPHKTFVVRKQSTADEYARRLGRPVVRGEAVTVAATWNTTTARRLLQSPVYTGEAFYRYKGGDEVLRNPGAHEALIDRTTWRRVQKIIGVPEHQRRAPAEEFPLSGGRALCASCGFPLIGGRMGTDRATGTGRRGYVCNTNKRKDRGQCEHPARVLAAPLEEYVRQLLAEFAEAREEQLEALLDDLGPELGVARLDWSDVRLQGLSVEERAMLRDVLGPGPDDALDAQRDALAVAEEELARLEALPDAPWKAAALEAQDRVVIEARSVLELAQAGAEDEAVGVPESTEVALASAGALGELLERYGLVACVEPAFGDRRPGRVAERVRLVPAEESV